ncbi:hypothetical protein D9M73_169530 [compost metagenome]
MQGPGHQFLAGTGFAFDQHWRQVAVFHALLGVEQLIDHALHRAHGRRFTDQGLEPGIVGLAFLVERQGALQALGFQGLVEQKLELGQ